METINIGTVSIYTHYVAYNAWNRFDSANTPCLYTDLSQQRPQPNNNALGTMTVVFVFFTETTGDLALGNTQ